MHQTGEIILPTGKRFQVVTQPAALQLTRDEKFILVFNFTPASSVTVIDRQKRKIVNEIDVPGCMLIYPQGRRGFATLCNDSSLLSMALDRTGKPSKPVRSAVFNNIDEDPLFMKPAWIDKKLYLASYMGGIQSVDLKGKKAKIDAMWRIPSNHRDALQNAKPSGWQVIATDSEERIYVLMRANAGAGDHKWGGQAVYVLDPKNRNLINVLPLKTDGFSIQVTNGKEPLLACHKRQYGNRYLYAQRRASTHYWRLGAGDALHIIWSGIMTAQLTIFLQWFFLLFIGASFAKKIFAHAYFCVCSQIINSYRGPYYRFLLRWWLLRKRWF